MPNKLSVRFRDPSTGQMHTVQGEVVKQFTKENPQSMDQLRNDNNDGKVDLFVNSESKGSYWSSSKGTGYHLQFDAGQLTAAQAKALADAVRSGDDGAVTMGEGRSFKPITLMTDLWTERADAMGYGTHRPDVSLAGDAGQPVFLAENGSFSIESGQEPASIEDAAAALSRAAESVDGLAEGENLFTSNGVSLEGRRAALTKVQELLVEGGSSGLSDNGKAQLRSSASTVITDMISSLGSEGEEGVLKAEAFRSLQGLVNNETVSGLKESMIFNAMRVQHNLPEEAAGVVDTWRNEIAPPTPPYDQWFKDGKKELNISFAAGHGEYFYEGMTELLTNKGFEIVDDGTRHSWRGDDVPRHFQLTRTVNGEEMKVNLYMRDFDNDSFKDIDNDDMDMIVYQGHSNLGANTRNSVNNAPDADGHGKLIFLGLCAGKDNVDRVRKAFPDAQLMTTFNSSYFNTKNVDGERHFAGGEDAKALMEIIDGALHRAPWSEINEDIRENAVGWNHKDKTIGNYLSPLELKLGGRLRDLDNDGQAQIMDRHFNVDVLNVEAGPSSSFTPRDNSTDGAKLNGEIPNLAAGFANTIDLYNPTYDNFSHKGRIVADGYYQGGDHDPVVRFDSSVVDGEKVYTMQVNDRYAHMGEEALRAITMVEYNKHLAATESDYPVKDTMKSELVGLLTAAASLTYDSGHRDASVFNALVKHYDLPAGLKWSDAGYLINKEKHHYTGSVDMAEKWIAKMDPATRDALATHFGQ